MNVYILRYLIREDHKDTEHADVTKEIIKEYNDNAKKILPATWIIKTDDSLSTVKDTIVNIIENIVKVPKDDYEYFLGTLVRKAWRFWLKKIIADWINSL